MTYKTYFDILGLTKHEIKRFSTYFRFKEGRITTEDLKSIKLKMHYLLQIFDKEEIIANPHLLAIPAHEIKMRFLILSQGFTKQEILCKAYLRKPTRQVFARMKFLQQTDSKLTYVKYAGLNFERIFSVSDSELQHQHPITMDEIENLEIEHLKKSETGHLLFLDEDEINSVLNQ